MLGPLLFTFYTCPAGDIIRRHDLHFQLYADDIQVYIRFIVLLTGKKKRLLCTRWNIVWLTFVRNYLKTSDNKTTAVVTTPTRHSNREITVIKLGKCDVIPSLSARNIGVVFDGGMWMEQQVTHVCQVAYWHLHTISTICSSITLNATVKLALAFVVSRLDFQCQRTTTGAAGMSHLPAAESAECCRKDGGSPQDGETTLAQSRSACTGFPSGSASSIGYWC